MSEDTTFLATFRPIVQDVSVFVERSPRWGAFPGEKAMQVLRWSLELDRLTPPEMWEPVYRQLQTLLAMLAVMNTVTPTAAKMAQDIRQQVHELDGQSPGS